MAKLSFTASLITQGKYRFFTLTMPADALARTCFVLTRDEDPEAGFQRLLNRDRAQQIADYIDSGLGTIPTAVVLSAQGDADFVYDSRAKTVSFEDFAFSFLILDGQHRVWGYRISKSELRVPVVIYEKLTRTDESRIFIDINTKQRPVPNELLLDIRKLADYQNDVETRLGEIFDLFDTQPGNPLLGYMSSAQRKKDHISRVTFNAAIKPILKLFGEADSEDIFNVLQMYYAAVIKVSAEKRLGIDLKSPIPFRGISGVFPDIADRVNYKNADGYTNVNFQKEIATIFENVKSSNLRSSVGSVTAYSNVIKDAMRPRSIF
jgi:DGQHR domain-containing protein